MNKNDDQKRSGFHSIESIIKNNPHKRVIAPKMWFGSAYQFHNTKDLYCDDWTVL